MADSHIISISHRSNFQEKEGSALLMNLDRVINLE